MVIVSVAWILYDSQPFLDSNTDQPTTFNTRKFKIFLIVFFCSPSKVWSMKNLKLKQNFLVLDDKNFKLEFIEENLLQIENFHTKKKDLSPFFFSCTFLGEYKLFGICWECRFFVPGFVLGKVRFWDFEGLSFFMWSLAGSKNMWYGSIEKIPIIIMWQMFTLLDTGPRSHLLRAFILFAATVACWLMVKMWRGAYNSQNFHITIEKDNWRFLHIFLFRKVII